jgi:phosphatidylglycerol---prolipoprotein diacylglyceryl transferase
MLSHNISPTIFKIGNIPITYYWSIYVIGFFVALFFLLRASTKKEINTSRKQACVLMFWGILGLMVGARLFHVIFWNLDYYKTYPDRILYFWQGGMSFHGGLIGALLAILIYCKIKKINFWKVADLLGLFGIILPAFTRIANFINQEIVGTVTNVPWCFKFKYADGCRHPVQLYASAGRFLFFFAMLGIKKKLKRFKEGFIFWLFIFGIGLGRFILDFIRKDTRYFDLTAGQLLSLPMIFLGVYILMKYYKRDIERIFDKSD